MEMVIREGRDGLDIAEADHAGERFTASSRNGATLKLARALVAAGAPDEDVSVYGAEGKLRFTAPSLHGLAAWTIKERDAGGLRLERHQNRPDFLPGEAQHGADGEDRSAVARDRSAA